MARLGPSFEGGLGLHPPGATMSLSRSLLLPVGLFFL